MRIRRFSADIPDIKIPATPDEVKEWYRTYLTVEGDMAGVAYWVAQSVTLGKEAARESFLSVVQGGDHNALVSSWYTKYAGGPGDAAGIAYWAGRVSTAGVARALDDFRGQIQTSVPTGITTVPAIGPAKIFGIPVTYVLVAAFLGVGYWYIKRNR